MGKIYKGQTNFTLRLKSKVDLANATVKKIQYKKPDSSTGFFIGTLDVDTSKLYWKPVSENSLDQVGLWTFWLDVTFADGSKAPSEVGTLYIYEVGSNDKS